MCVCVCVCVYVCACCLLPFYKQFITPMIQAAQNTLTDYNRKNMLCAEQILNWTCLSNMLNKIICSQVSTAYVNL